MAKYEYKFLGQGLGLGPWRWKHGALTAGPPGDSLCLSISPKKREKSTDFAVSILLLCGNFVKAERQKAFSSLISIQANGVWSAHPHCGLGTGVSRISGGAEGWQGLTRGAPESRGGTWRQADKARDPPASDESLPLFLHRREHSPLRWACRPGWEPGRAGRSSDGRGSGGF